MKVVLLGIDGATPSVLSNWVQEGRLPNLGRVFEAGAHGTLRSTLPPYSVQAWVSMMTGRHPASHGVVDFFERDPGQAQHTFIQSAAIHGESLWDIVTRHGVQAGFVNVPLTYPPVPLNGYMVSGFMTPRGRDDYTYPPELRGQILSVTGEYDPDPWDLASPDQNLPAFQHWMAIAEKAATHLHEAWPVDMYVNVVQALDQLQHHYWDLIINPEARQSAHGTQAWPLVDSCYTAVDKAIGRRLSWLDEDSVLFLASDHGFQPVNRWFHVNSWLAERGYLRQMQGARSSLSSLGLSRERLKRLVQRLDPLGLRRVLGRFTRAAIADKLDDRLHAPIDWSATRAYSGSRTSEGIYINLQGRESQGIVQPGEEYERLREEIIQAVTALVDPDTRLPVVSGAYRREDVSQGEFLDQLPDILLAFDDRPYLVSESAGGEVCSPMVGEEVTGRHHSHGLFAAIGANVNAGLAVEASIVDVAPTMLYAMGLPIPADMDGRVLEEIFTDEFRAQHPIAMEGPREALAGRRGPSGLDAAEEAEIEDRLRALGYLG